jgi:hypothetical protein
LKRNSKRINKSTAAKFVGGLTTRGSNDDDYVAGIDTSGAEQTRLSVLRSIEPSFNVDKPFFTLYVDAASSTSNAQDIGLATQILRLRN